MDNELLKLPADRFDINYVTIVNGMCPDGADWSVFKWARNYWWVFTEEHPVTPEEWQKIGKSAGFKRNDRMVESGADRCIAFLMPCSKSNCARKGLHDSHGGGYTATLAEVSGIPVIRYRMDKDGNVDVEET